ncbi:hypothetical protein CAP36_01875 [Chitinophagaceae bacterium IBVUCB2]|nr:hypothetical protein CAP36_01875 [Chitinophagaceae bacterium IBVUCB2]
MSKVLLVIGALLMSVCSSGQVYLTDPINGKPYTIKQYEDVQGSAWLFEDWKTAYVTDKFGTTHLNVQIRFDLYANKFFYNYNNTVYEFVTTINEVEIFLSVPGDTTNRMIFRRGFSINDVVGPLKYLQVMAEGRVTFLKYLYKSLDETTEYNVPGKIKTFNSRSTFFYLKDGKSQSQKPGSKILEELTNDKWAEVDAYMKQNSLSAKNEADFARAIKYYNTL